MTAAVVHYFASAREAAGASQETLEAGTLDGLLSLVRAGHDPTLSRILDVSSPLLDGVRVSRGAVGHRHDRRGGGRLPHGSAAGFGRHLRHLLRCRPQPTTRVAVSASWS